MKTMTIITGASRGLGLALARASLRPMDTVVTLERNPVNTLTAEAKNLECEFVQFSADLVDLSAGITLLNWWLSEDEVAKFDRICLINNAGVLGPVGPIENAEPQEIADCMKVNFESPALLISTFLKLTENSGCDRRIMNISSGAARKSVPGWTLYCSTKAGLDRLSATIAADEAQKPNGAKICAIAPGVVNTDMQEMIRNSNETDFPTVQKFIDLYANNELTDPDTCARQLISYLHSDAFGSEPIADIRTLSKD